MHPEQVVKRTLYAALVATLAAIPSLAQSPQLLSGTITGAQNHTYVEVPFEVPANTARVTLQFAYTGKEDHTTIDLGLEDPDRTRCWSGGNKSILTVAPSDATPSCEPGAIPSGTWKVLLGVPNIRPNSLAHYTIKLWLSQSAALADEPAILRVPLRTGPAWYRGDLHMHTGHSDGTCPSLTGKTVPCPVFITAETAEKRGLDFIAISDHNATSQYNSMRELQPYFDNLLLIPAREITTFYGHLNLIGATQYVDWRLGTTSVPDIDTLLRAMDATGAVTSVNHPLDPTGEACMGCGFTPPTAPDLSLLNAVEVINGTNADTPHSGIPYWFDALNQGIRLTAIGGSDTHRPLANTGSSIGVPSTVVYATELSIQAILEGIRAGHVFLDAAGTRTRSINLTATTAAATARMGDTLLAPANSTVELTATTAPAEGASTTLLLDGHPLASTNSLTLRKTWPSDGKRHWVLAEARGPDGKLWLLGNPIYINWTSAKP